MSSFNYDNTSGITHLMQFEIYILTIITLCKTNVYFVGKTIHIMFRLIDGFAYASFVTTVDLIEFILIYSLKQHYER